MPLGFITCLFLVATQHLILGLFVTYCSPVELSGGLFLPIIIKSLESDALFLLLVYYGQVQDMAPWRQWENVCWGNEPDQQRGTEASRRQVESV